MHIALNYRIGVNCNRWFVSTIYKFVSSIPNSNQPKLFSNANDKSFFFSAHSTPLRAALHSSDNKIYEDIFTILCKVWRYHWVWLLVACKVCTLFTCIAMDYMALHSFSSCYWFGWIFGVLSTTGVIVVIHEIQSFPKQQINCMRATRHKNFA